MEPSAEIALARSAAPESISRDAEVMVLGRHGYETAVQGKNGFVCMVERSGRHRSMIRFLESKGASSDLLQCGCRAHLPSENHQEDGPASCRTNQISDD